MAMTKDCSYCRSTIPRSASRCPQCAGEYRVCPKCHQLSAVSRRQKFVGALRGGMKEQLRSTCHDAVVDGPRF